MAKYIFKRNGYLPCNDKMTSTSWRSLQKSTRKKTPEATEHMQNDPTSDNTIGHYYVHRKANMPLCSKRKTAPPQNIDIQMAESDQIGSK